MEKVKLKVLEMKNNCPYDDSVIVAHYNGYLHAFTPSGELIGLNMNTVIEDKVSEPMIVTLTLKCRMGEVVND